MKNILIMISFAVFLFALMCNTVSEEEFVTGPTTLDGQGFMSVSIDDITLKYRIENDSLHCILSSQTRGWVAVGFNPSNRMKDANFIIGYVMNGIPIVRDDWGIQSSGHQSDVSLGGSDDVRIVRGQEGGGITEIEFLIPFNSGDAFDGNLNLGQSYPVLLARGAVDNFTTQHTRMGQMTIVLSSSQRLIIRN